MMTLLSLVQPATIHAWSEEGPGEWWWLWRLAMFLIWIVLIFFVVRFVSRGRHHGHSPMDQARGVLAERFARGEIDAEEYRKRSETLK